MKLRLELQYFEDCPNHEILRNNLYSAIKGIEDKVEITEVIVNDIEMAKKIKFRGSPTLLIDGEDLASMPEPDETLLSCRFYLGGIPSTEEIREKILNKLKRAL